MAAVEALAKALLRTQERRFTQQGTDEADCRAFAADIIAALPEGWFLGSIRSVKAAPVTITESDFRK